MTRPGRLLFDPDLARIPLLSTGRRRVRASADWVPAGTLYGEPVAVRTLAGEPTPRDGLLLARALTEWDTQGRDPSRQVVASAREAARWLGYPQAGGRQVELAHAAIARLAGTTIRSARRGVGGGLVTEWPILDLPRERVGGAYTIRVSAAMADAVVRGRSTYLDPMAFTTLLDRDAMAARLWLMLESERLQRPWSYSVFGAPPGAAASVRDLPPVADLLRVVWSNRGDFVKRLRAASRVIESVDARYTLAVLRSPGRGMWRLEARRFSGTEGIQGTRPWHVPAARHRVYSTAHRACTGEPRPAPDTVASPVVSTVGASSTEVSGRVEPLDEILERVSPGWKERLAALKAEAGGR